MYRLGTKPDVQHRNCDEIVTREFTLKIFSKLVKAESRETATHWANQILFDESRQIRSV
jgi:hypothetical protein